MKTAVDYLVEQLNEIGFHTIVIQKVIDKAKEMEKDQICEAYAIGGSPLLGPWEFGEDYYEQTYQPDESNT